MTILLFGATGMIGRRILSEALERGHEVTAVVRDPASLTESHPHLHIVSGNVLSSADVSRLATDHDLVISAYGPGGEGVELLVDAAHSLIEGFEGHPGIRLIVVGGAGSLEVAPGLQLVDTPDFPAAWKGLALAHREALEIYRKSDGVNWTYVSPPALIEPGRRTGKYKIGTDRLLMDENGRSQISAEDFAVAVLDEVENPRFERKRFTVRN